MDYDQLYKLLTLTVMLNDHPRLSSMRRLVNHEIDSLMADADKEADELDARIKADKEAAANAKARRHQAGVAIPSATARSVPADELAESNPPYRPATRDTYEGVPGPAEPVDTPDLLNSVPERRI